MQFSDLQGVTLNDIAVKDSKLHFVTFRNCKLKKSKFLNCDIFFGSFYGGDLTDAIFENCKIELTLFEDAIFDRTKIEKSHISYSGMFNTNIGGLDMSTSTQIKVFTNPSQITPGDVEQGMSRIWPFMEALDTQIKSKIKEVIKRDAEKHDLPVSPSFMAPTYKNEKELTANPILLYTEHVLLMGNKCKTFFKIS